MTPQEQNEGIPFGVLGGTVPVIARAGDGVGLRLPERQPGREHVQWYELDLDDDFNDPDVEQPHPLPTERHRSIPD